MNNIIVVCIPSVALIIFSFSCFLARSRDPFDYNAFNICVYFKMYFSSTIPLTQSFLKNEENKSRRDIAIRDKLKLSDPW